MEIKKRFDNDFLIKTICHQIGSFFMESIDEKKIKKFVDIALSRFATCVEPIKLKYYRIDGQPYFDQYHSDHYAIFLYLLSRSCYENGEERLAELTFLLNKYLHGLDAFYKVELPNIFMFVHPLGTVIGDATFNNYTVFYQNVTIGSTANGIYPIFDEYTIFYSKSTVIGNCKCGNNVVFGANSLVINKTIDPNNSVIGSVPDLKLNSLDHNFLKKHFFE